MALTVMIVTMRDDQKTGLIVTQKPTAVGLPLGVTIVTIVSFSQS